MNMCRCIDKCGIQAHDLGMPKPGFSHLSKSVEDYLKVIWLNSRAGAVATSTVAAALGVSDASVSGMLGKLSELALVRYTRYHGAALTPSGERAARCASAQRSSSAAERVHNACSLRAVCADFAACQQDFRHRMATECCLVRRVSGS